MRCHSLDLGFERVAGTGTIQTFSIMRGSPPPGFEAATPYAVLAVELDEQERLIVMGNLVGASCEEAAIGRRVHVAFEVHDDGFALPVFALDDDHPAVQ